MDKLIEYLKTLSVSEQHDFADRCSTTVSYLRKACSKGQKFGPLLCTSIETESGGQVTRQDLLPDSWEKIWPELATIHAQGGIH